MPQFFEIWAAASWSRKNARAAAPRSSGEASVCRQMKVPCTTRTHSTGDSRIGLLLLVKNHRPWSVDVVLPSDVDASEADARPDPTALIGGSSCDPSLLFSKVLRHREPTLPVVA